VTAPSTRRAEPVHTRGEYPGYVVNMLAWAFDAYRDGVRHGRLQNGAGPRPTSDINTWVASTFRTLLTTTAPICS
jgi:hypothetical protein